MSKLRDGLEVGGNGIMYILTATQTKEIFEIISLVLSILISVIIIVSKLVSWLKKSMADGKITKEEVQEGVDIIKVGADDLKDKLNKDKEGK